MTVKATTRIAVATLVVVVLVQVATAQPSPGFSKTAPLSGTGTTSSPLKITVCPTSGHALISDGTSWLCGSAGGGGVSDGDKGDVTVSGGGATWTVDPQAITLAKMANIATARIIGRVTASTGSPEALTGTQATTLLDPFTSSLKGLVPASGGGTTNYLRADGTFAAPPGSGGVTDGDKGDVTVSGGGATWTVDAQAITLAKMANIATARFIGRTTAGTGDPEALTGTQATALLDLASTSATTKGLVPGSNGGGTGVFLNGSLGWTAETGDIAGITTTAPLSGGCTTGTCALTTTFTTNRLAGRLTAGTGVIEELTGTQVTTTLDAFTSSLKGLAPASGGGTANYLRADGTWAPPPSMATLAPSATTGTVNDWAAGVSSDAFVAATTSGTTNLTGMTGGATGRRVIIYNAGTSDVILANNSGSSTAGNRFVLGGATVNLKGTQGCSISLTYNASAWYESGFDCSTWSGTSVSTTLNIVSGNNIVAAGNLSGGTYVSAPTVYAANGVFMREVDNSFGGAFGTNATAEVSMNKVGYQEGILQFRDFGIYNGKGARYVAFTGTDKATTFSGAVSVEDSVGKLSTKSASAVLTLTACGTSPTFSGDRTAVTVTTGTGTTACTINFNNAFANTPTCVVTAQPAAAKGFAYTTSTTRVDITSGAASTKYDIICVDHF